MWRDFAPLATLVALVVASCGAASTPPLASGLSCQAPPDPPPPAPGPDRTDIQFRSAAGLRSDVAYIDSVKESPTANRSLGVALTPEEFNELQFRDTVIGPALVSGQVQTYVSQNNATFGGDYLDNKAGGVDTFLFTQSDPGYLTRLSAMIPYPSRVTVRTVRHSKAELDALQVHITDALMRSVKFHSIGEDIPRNVVQVNVEACDSSTFEALAAFPPDELYIFQGAQASTSTATP